MIQPKTPAQIKTLRKGGVVTAEILEEVFQQAQPGVKTIFLEEYVDKLLQEKNLRSAFKGFEKYPYHLVTCINEEVVHGMPGEKTLKEGDLLTIDFGLLFEDLYTDMADTRLIGSNNKNNSTSFLDTGKTALAAAINKCTPDNHVGDISVAMQSAVESAGYNVLRAFVGHGVGFSLHEDPQIPCFGNPGIGPKLKEGMVLAVEVMYTQGDYTVQIKEDGWTTVTKDGSLSAMFEHSVAITKEGPLILTKN